MTSVAYSVCKRFWNQRTSKKKRSDSLEEEPTPVTDCIMKQKGSPTALNDRSPNLTTSTRLPRMIRPGKVTPPSTNSTMPKYLNVAAKAFGKRPSQKRSSMSVNEGGATPTLGTTNIPTAVPSAPVSLRSSSHIPKTTPRTKDSLTSDTRKESKSKEEDEMGSITTDNVRGHSTRQPKQVPNPNQQEQQCENLPAVKKDRSTDTVVLAESRTTTAETQTEPMNPALNAGSVTIMVSQPAASVRIGGSGCIHRSRRQQKTRSGARVRPYRNSRVNEKHHTPDLTCGTKLTLKPAASTTTPTDPQPTVDELKARLDILEQAVVPLLSLKQRPEKFERGVQCHWGDISACPKAMQCSIGMLNEQKVLNGFKLLRVRMELLTREFSDRASIIEQRVDKLNDKLGDFPIVYEMKDTITNNCTKLIKGVCDRIDVFDRQIERLRSKMRPNGVIEEKQRRVSVVAPCVEEFSRSMLEHEVTSLRSILDLKMDELYQMRCRCEQLKTEAAEASRLRDRLDKCEREKENLLAMIRIQQEKNRSAQIRATRLNEKLGREVIERKRLECENEQLKFNLNGTLTHEDDKIASSQ